ncbi:MAG: aminopeptidase [Lachnospiraceae bacterium]|nr:aminopeptidase [Lachnospiraceae bacterium]
MTDYRVNAMEERYMLAMERIGEMLQEQTVPAPFDSYFRNVAEFLIMLKEVREELVSGRTGNYTLEQWQQQNYRLYEDILPEHYGQSYGNPEFACRMLGETHGKILSFLYAELRGLIGYVFEEQSAAELLEAITVHLELFIEVYNCFEQKEAPSYKEIQQILYWFVSDYSDVLVTERIRQSVDPARDFAVRIILDSDLGDLRYLYRYGEYVTENELQTAAFLNSLEEAQIQAMADTYTEGYRMGFVHGGKDLSRKLTVNLRYHLGFERMVRAAIRNFDKLGLRPVVFRYALSTVNKRGAMRLGYTGAVPNKQFDYDHREDAAVYLDRKFVERRLGVMRSAYETFQTLAAGHAGPAVIEIFGEKPFVPESRDAVYHLSEKQQQLMVKMNNEAGQLTNQYIIGKERSFTIIAFPVPEIGADFPQIFRETVKINTLDYALYQRLQQTIIDALDGGTRVRVTGRNGNRTDLTVALQPLKDPEKETIFENCVADVNIPVGEVFTSPQLKGTDGVLHVSRVFLNELEYKDLTITLKDGMITDYSCANFADDEENRDYIRANVLFHHDTLPIGEFAIGTNTTAYAMAKKYGIGAKLPILIAEKMGPHFAMGDTCYSWDEDNAVYNPDGKEIIAKENEISRLRKEDPGKAYFGCHTDITIPYEELGLLAVEGENGYRKEIIRDGRFVLEGTQELNLPLEE